MTTPRQLIPRGVYHHYKGGLYRVLMLVTREDDRSQLVVYRREGDGVSPIWARPLSEWHQDVLVDGVRVARYTAVGY